ncbi:hypothetical protein FISHEDRAFT_12619, partial [Fistulina hepatica ATCC 64428]
MIIEYAEETSRRGFPLSQHHIREHANAILHARLGDELSKKAEVGMNWVKRFVSKHSQRLKAFWSHPLDHSR